MVSAAFLLAQAETIAEQCDTPLFLLDDLASEFDEEHYRKVLGQTLGYGGQVWVTGTEQQQPGEDRKVFHVEHGKVAEVV
jgi:recombinational DNA repair ATPase RecF